MQEGVSNIPNQSGVKSNVNERLVKLLKIKNKKIKRLQLVCKKGRNAIKDLRKKSTQTLVQNIMKGCTNKVSFNLLINQIQMQHKKPRGRRWSIEDKAVALSIYKRSPKAYRLLQCFLCLPSRATMLSLLSSIPMNAGICNSIFEQLKKYAHQMDEDDRICVLIFDEMSLKQHLEYDTRNDVISGFEDFGTERRSKYSNMALAFLVQGIRKPWKQPVAFYLVNNKMESSKGKTNTSNYTLDYCITEVLTACMASGLNVVATICDMGTSNVSALHQLGFSYDQPKIDVNGTTIHVFFDPSHLLKCTRNLFLKYPVECEVTLGNNNILGRATMDDVIKAVELDKQNLFRTVPKITSEHLRPNAFSKMRVFLAAQLLSHSVASLLLYSVSTGT